MQSTPRETVYPISSPHHRSLSSFGWAHPRVKQTENAMPINASDFERDSVVVTSPMMAVLSWTLPSLRPPIKRESRNDA